MSTVDWVTFDCYGTLIDWEGGVIEALGPFLPSGDSDRALAERYIAAEAEVEGEAYRPYSEVLAVASGRLMAALGRPLPADQSRVLPESLPCWRPFPEVAESLRAVRAGGRHLAILSNVDRELLARSIMRLGVEPDLTVTAEDCRSYKPAPGHWKRFRELSGASPAFTVHVAASIFHDIVPAAAQGYRTVFINRHGSPQPLGAVAPTRTLPDLKALPGVIDELASS